jgi:hypothetical protein
MLLEGGKDLNARLREAGRAAFFEPEAYDPSAPLEAASMVMGGTPIGAAKGAMGSGPISRLAMDETSRMARAHKMGFIIDAYRGEGQALRGGEYQIRDPGRYDPGFLGGDAIYATNKPHLANDYASLKSYKLRPDEAAPNVVPLKLKMENPLTISGKEKVAISKLEQHDRDAWFRNNVTKKGYDGVIVKFNDAAGTEEYVIPKTAQMRSRYARFDPAAEESGYLLGSGPVKHRETTGHR